MSTKCAVLYIITFWVDLRKIMKVGYSFYIRNIILLYKICDFQNTSYQMSAGQFRLRLHDIPFSEQLHNTVIMTKYNMLKY